MVESSDVLSVVQEYVISRSQGHLGPIRLLFASADLRRIGCAAYGSRPVRMFSPYRRPARWRAVPFINACSRYDLSGRIDPRMMDTGPGR